MKNYRLALMFLACSAAFPVFAQGALPQCENSNYDQARGIFIVNSPAPDTVNQQCLLTVIPTQAAASGAQYPVSHLVEGYYAIEMSGGGGGGGGGASKDSGGGGGGAGAAPFNTIKLLSPGVYKLTLGTGGEGGKPGGYTQDGNPTSLTNFDTGEHVAGFEGADVWRQHTQAPGSGLGGAASEGGSSGGDGGDAGARNSESAAQSGGVSQTAGYSGMAGQAGGETGRSAQKDGVSAVQANAGGGGGAGVGSGGAGDSATGGAATRGDLGGGGGGGSGHAKGADSGSRGGHGFIRLSMYEAIPQAIAPAAEVVAAAPEIVAPAPVMQRHSLSTDTLFDFNKSTLKPAGEAKLDDLVNKLSSVNDDSITVTGHADRIGSPEINQKLSVGRAESVKAYLVSKGVQSDRISVVGKGEMQPVTSADACKGPATPKVIACLQPDRRVDVEAVVTNKVLGMN